MTHICVSPRDRNVNFVDDGRNNSKAFQKNKKKMIRVLLIA